MPDKPVNAAVEPSEARGIASIDLLAYEVFKSLETPYDDCAPLESTDVSTIAEAIRQGESRGETRERERCAKTPEALSAPAENARRHVADAEPLAYAAGYIQACAEIAARIRETT